VSKAAPFRLLDCDDDARRALLAPHPLLQGTDYLEVVTAPPADNQLVLELHFVPKTSPAGAAALSSMLDDLVADHSLVSIRGGERVRGIGVADVVKVGDMLQVRVDERGDFSTYTLHIDHTSMDPAAAEIDFSFKAGCPSRFDCKPRRDCPPEPREEPAIDYMAKDYASFRQALLDYLPTIVPDWRERHEADLTVALVELFAYLGDLLSYEQDAVANEAYLETARQRVSVRRHARLVDYRLNDGASARASVHYRVRGGAAPGSIPPGAQVLTRLVGPIGQMVPPHPAILAPARPSDVEAVRDAAGAVFETVDELWVAEPLNEIRIHTWADGNCCAPRSTTALHLVGDLAYVDGSATRSDPWRLRDGSHIVFEEIAGPVTGLAADADPRHRQVVRLVAAAPANDPLTGRALTRVAWADADALTFPLCVSVVDEPGTPPRLVSVARGNIGLADHGLTYEEWHPVDPGWFGPPPPAPPGPGIDVGDRPFRLALREAPLSRRLPAPAGAAARDLLGADPHEAVAQVELLIGPTAPEALTWDAAPEGLLDRDGFDPAFVVETDDAGRATLRFGDDVYGMSPPDGSYVRATYRVGLGARGNAGAGALRHLLKPDPGYLLPDIVEVRNPLPAFGGEDPEPIERAKHLAPDAFRAIRLRAVTERDYAEVTERHPDVSHALATFRWTGSWHTVFVTVDPKGRTDLPETTRRRVLDWVTRFTQTGYDLEIQAPSYVPLQLELHVCAQRGHLRADVERAVLEALSAEPGHFFDPDRFTFGQPLYLSALYAAIETVPGVDSVTALRFSRQRDDDPLPARPVTAANVDRGFVAAERLEVLQLENDPSLPERGVLRLVTGGGS
jgi:hypothetical protein